MAVHDTPEKPDKREALRLYEAGELSEEEARQLVGDDWNAVVTGTMMEDDLEDTDWDDRYDDESVF